MKIEESVDNYSTDTRANLMQNGLRSGFDRSSLDRKCSSTNRMWGYEWGY